MIHCKTAPVSDSHIPGPRTCRHGVKKLLFLGSSCIYPKHALQPMTEDCLLTGALEPTNEWYAVAKIAGIKVGGFWYGVCPWEDVFA